MGIVGPAAVAELTLWLKVLSGLVALFGLPLLFWAWSVSRSLTVLERFAERHDFTLREIAKTPDHFAGVFKSLRKVERALLDVWYRQRDRPKPSPES